MRTLILLFISVFFISIQNIRAQESNFQLIPLTGKKYIYQYDEATYLKDENGGKLDELVRTKILEIEYFASKPDGKMLLHVRVKRNMVRKPEEKPYMFIW